MGALISLAGIASAGLGLASQLSQNRHRRDALEAQSHRDEATAARDVVDTRREAAEEERNRREALRRSIARRRAQLGGQGVGVEDGSGEALLLGLVGDAAIGERSRAEETASRIAAIRDDRTYRRRVNLLDRSRLADKARFSALTRITDRF